MDFLSLRECRVKKARELAKYHALTPEQKKIHNRKITLRRNPKAKQRSYYHKPKGINL